MFLLPVFAQEILHYTATLSGIVLMPRTLAMMAMSPFIGRIYNKVQPAWIVGVGVVLFAIGIYQLSHITLDTSRDGNDRAADRHRRRVRVPVRAADHRGAHRRSSATRWPMPPGLNSFVRQIGGSVGLTIFATMFTNYAVEARARARDARHACCGPRSCTRLARDEGVRDRARRRSRDRDDEAGAASSALDVPAGDRARVRPRLHPPGRPVPGRHPASVLLACAAGIVAEKVHIELPGE